MNNVIIDLRKSEIEVWSSENSTILIADNKEILLTKKQIQELILLNFQNSILQSRFFLNQLLHCSFFIRSSKSIVTGIFKISANVTNS